jgi:hypothetical protein
MDNGAIRNCQVCSRGCAISVASGSMLAELLPGRTCEECERLSEAFRAMLHGEEPPKDIDLGDLDALHGVAKFPSDWRDACLDDAESAPRLRRHAVQLVPFWLRMTNAREPSSGRSQSTGGRGPRFREAHVGGSAVRWKEQHHG